MRLLLNSKYSLSDLENSKTLFLAILGLIVAVHLFYFFGSSQRSFSVVHFSKNLSVVSSIKVKLITQIKPVVKKRVLKKKMEVVKKSIVPVQKKDEIVSPRNVLDRGQQNHLARYLSKVRSTINQNKFYPRIAKRLKQQGVVKVRIAISKVGKITLFEIVEKSHYHLLNQAVLKTLRKIKSFGKIPTVIKRQFVEVIVPVVYEII